MEGPNMVTSGVRKKVYVCHSASNEFKRTGDEDSCYMRDGPTEREERIERTEGKRFCVVEISSASKKCASSA